MLTPPHLQNCDFVWVQSSSCHQISLFSENILIPETSEPRRGFPVPARLRECQGVSRKILTALPLRRPEIFRTIRKHAGGSVRGIMTRRQRKSGRLLQAIITTLPVLEKSTPLTVRQGVGSPFIRRNLMLKRAAMQITNVSSKGRF